MHFTLIQVLPGIHHITDPVDESIESLWLVCMNVVPCFCHSVNVHIGPAPTLEHFIRHIDVVPRFAMSHPRSAT